MEMTFDGCGDRILLPFYDDVTIKSVTFDEHLDNVDLILVKTRKTGFTLNALKSKFVQTKISYLGHIIGGGKISLDPKRTEVIKNFPIPKNVKEVRRFIGMTQFCRRFVKNSSTILSPIYNLTRTNTIFRWTDDCNDAFQKVKYTHSCQEFENRFQGLDFAIYV